MRSWIGQVRLSLLQEPQTDWSWSHGWEKRQCLKPGWWCLPGFDLPRWTTSTGLWKLPMPLIKDNWPSTMRCGLRIAVALFLEWASLVGTWNFYSIYIYTWIIMDLSSPLLNWMFHLMPTEYPTDAQQRPHFRVGVDSTAPNQVGYWTVDLNNLKPWKNSSVAMLLSQVCASQLSDLVELVRGELSKLARRTLTASRPGAKGVSGMTCFSLPNV